jgi:hypothetical protein
MIAAGFAPGPRVTMADQMWPMVAVSAALAGLALAGMAIDGRVLGEVNVWVKPLKFAVSFAVYFATLALVVDRLGAVARRSMVLRIALGVAVVAAIGELAYLFLSAGQGVASHFNFSDAFRATMYSVMGAGAVLLMLAVALVGWLVWRDGAAAMGPGLRLGVLVGFAASTGLTLVTAGVLSSNGGHFVGVPGAAAGTLPVFGWSTAVGDLRPAHFLALHAMQVLPLAGLWFDRKGIAVQRMRWVALAYVALTGVVFAQALSGMPLIRL